MRKTVIMLATALLFAGSVGAQNFSPNMKVFDGAAQTDTVNVVNVYIASSEVNFGQESNTLEMALKSLMAADGYEFVENETEGDYKVTLKGQTREGSGDQYIKNCFAKVSVTVFDNAKRKSVYSNELEAKGGETTWHLAGQDAYKNVAAKVYKAIKPYLKNNKK